MDRPPPFEPLPTDPSALRRRAIRDGLIISGWLVTGFTLVVLPAVAKSLGYDAFSYWSIDFADLYGRAFESNFTLGAFRYTPPIAFLFAPLTFLPWWLFLWTWLAAMVGTLFWLGGRWALVLLAVPFVALELEHGNVHIFMAAAIALGFRHPWAWSFAILTKVTPGVGLIWFAARREFRSLAIAVAVTTVICLASYVVAPQYWSDWVRTLVSNLDEPQSFSVPPALTFRLPIAALIVFWGARTDRPWTVAVAATLGLPIIWPHGLCVLLAAVPFLRLGDRAANVAGWKSAVTLRGFVGYVAGAVGIALAVAAVAGGPIRQVMDDASRWLFPRGIPL
jgi:hypothetical protein